MDMIVAMIVTVRVIMSAAAAARVVMVVIVIVRMAMCVVVPMLMIVCVMAAAAAAVVVVMILGIDQRGGEPLLDGDRGLARRLGVLDDQRHNLGAEAHVVDGAEVVAAQAALAVEQQ